MKKLNGDDEDIFIYSDARSTHDVIASSEGEKIIRVHKSGSQFSSYQSNRRLKHVGHFGYYFGGRSFFEINLNILGPNHSPCF